MLIDIKSILTHGDRPEEREHVTHNAVQWTNFRRILQHPFEESLSPLTDLGLESIFSRSNFFAFVIVNILPNQTIWPHISVSINWFCHQIGYSKSKVLPWSDGVSFHRTHKTNSYINNIRCILTQNLNICLNAVHQFGFSIGNTKWIELILLFLVPNTIPWIQMGMSST